MLGCNKHDLRNALLTRSLEAGGKVHVSNGGSRTMTERGEMLTVPLDGDQARAARNNLVQEVQEVWRDRRKGYMADGKICCLLNAHNASLLVVCYHIV